MRLKKIILVALVLCLFPTGITGQAAEVSVPLEISSAQVSLRVVNGGTAMLTVNVTNIGATGIQQIQPALELPYKWMTEKCEPQSVNLTPGESGSFQLMLTVPASQSTSTQEILLTCGNAEVSSNQLSIPVTISTNPGYLWIVLAGVLIVAIAAVLYFKKHGRR